MIGFLEHVVVTRFDEKCIYQVSIGEDEWFFRYEFLYTAKRITVSPGSLIFLDDASLTSHPAKGNTRRVPHMQGAVYPRTLRAGKDPPLLSTPELLQLLPPVMLGEERLRH